MQINKEGKLEIDLDEIVNRLSPEHAKDFVKSACVSRTVVDWVVNWICGEDEDGWWDSGDFRLREAILKRIAKKQEDNISRYNWSLIDEADKKLRFLLSEEHLYYRLYHHPNKYETTIAKFLGESDHENQFQFKSEQLNKKVQEVIDIVKNAIKS